MKKAIVVGTIVVAAAVAAAIYLTDESADRSAATNQPASGVEAAKPGAGAQPDSQYNAPGESISRRSSADSKTDPRLAALSVSPDNGLIEFIAGPDGKVIKEIDNDPGSPSFKKPLREYTYSGNQVIGLTAYRYAGDHIQISTTRVSYKPDGSIDQHREKTDFDYGNNQPPKADR